MNPFLSNYSQEEVRPRHVDPESFNDEKTASFEFTIPDPDEIKILKMQLVEKEAINKKFQKEREEKIMKSYEEKHDLLRRISALKKKNVIATNAWQPEIIG